jgi:hypothetical protein
MKNARKKLMLVVSTKTNEIVAIHDVSGMDMKLSVVAKIINGFKLNFRFM